MRLSRYKAIKVRTPMKRSGPIKAKKRSATDFARVYGSRERVRWIKSLPCCVSGLTGETENAHVIGGGMGRKADACWIIPLDRALHANLHRIGVRSFEAKYEVSLTYLAELTEQSWQRHINRSETP